MIKETLSMMMETLPSGTVLHGRYRIERVLGSGGFGHVYLSVDLQTNQQYAIKEYLVAGASGKAQLEHEARVLSHLHHPNLPAFQAAFDERGRYYIVLGYIEGSDLTDLIRVVRQRNEVVPLARILTWIISICDAVTFLHRQNPAVIHRDIKPDNIRITPNGTAVLVDMGNAKATADGARTLFFIRHQGTPGYAPPEQYPGGTGTDVRSDVYALGGTLFYALTGHEPPSVSTRNQSIQQGQPDLPSLKELLANNPPEQAADPARQFRLGISKPAKPAPRHSRHLAQLGQLLPELLDRLNRIIKRAMALRPERRYQSVAELSNDLQDVLAALSTQQPKPAREVSPYSTQPDLPLVFETIQEAREKEEQEQAPTSAPTNSPPVTAKPSSVPLPRCPHCDAELTSQAVFCSRCGYSLTNKPKADTATRLETEPEGKSNNPSAQNKAPVHDISTEQTMMIMPKAQNSSHAPMTGTPSLPDAKPPTFPSPPASQNRPRVPTHPATQAHAPRQQVAHPPTPPLQNSSPRKGSSAPGSNSSRPQTGERQRATIIMIVLFIVMLIVLIILAIFLLSSHQKTRGNSLHEGRPRDTIEAPAYERNLSLCVASSIAPATARIRACRAGISAVPGIT